MPNRGTFLTTNIARRSLLLAEPTKRTTRNPRIRVQSANSGILSQPDYLWERTGKAITSALAL